MTSTTTTGSTTTTSTVATLTYTWHYFFSLLRRPDTVMFCLGLPTALFLMFGTATQNSHSVLEAGTVSAFVMTGMGLYGGAIAMTSIAGAAAHHRQQGWNRQLHLAGLTTTQSVIGTIIAMFAFAALPIIVLFTVAGTTGTHFDHPWQWATTGILSWCSTLPFTLYGLAAALWLRSESATGIAAGSLVILAFFGGVFMPLSGTLFDLSRFTPFYGPVTIAHWPHMTGHYYAADGHLVTTESFAFALTATLAWTIMFATVCVIGARQSTQR